MEACEDAMTLAVGIMQSFGYGMLGHAPGTWWALEGMRMIDRKPPVPVQASDHKSAGVVFPSSYCCCDCQSQGHCQMCRMTVL